MINAIEIIENFSGTCGIWMSACEDGDMARVAEYAIAHDVKYISVVPDAVARVWPWLEKTGIQIYARFYMDAPARAYMGAMSDLCTRVRAAFANGADGAQIFIKHSDLRRFVGEMLAIRDDLFFNKKLCIGVEISDIEPSDWASVFDALAQIRADAVIFAITKYDVNKSDFVGRVYGALDMWNGGDMELHFALGVNYIPMEQAMRLVQKMQPTIAPNTKFWVRW